VPRAKITPVSSTTEEGLSLSGGLAIRQPDRGEPPTEADSAKDLSQ
jgi:hypothetical protein